MIEPGRPGHAGDRPRQGPGTSLQLQILGPLRLWRDGVELDAGPRQQAYLLALLLARAGRLISTNDLIDLIWDDDVVPPSALNVVHKYVGALRRLLEPGLPARGTGSYLQRRVNGYVFVAGPGELDVVTFRELVGAAKLAHTEPRDDQAALDRYTEALRLWHGPAGEGLRHGTTAIPIFAALDREFLDTAVAAADLAITLDQPERVLEALQLAATMAPLHEPVQAGLVTTLAAAGRQAEAVSVFRGVRIRLADELGIDPGPALQAAYQRVLNQTLNPPRRAPMTEAGARARTGASRAPARPTEGLVGRVEEAAALRRTVESAFAGGTGLALVEGDPGVGKTRLLEEAAAEADRRGAHVVWGHCLEGDGTPSMWPWVQAIGTILDGLPPAAREKWLAGELGGLVETRGDVLAEPMMPESGSQFRLFEQVVGVVGEASAQRPHVMIIDDLHWADVASLHLFAHLAAGLPHGTVLLGAFRTHAPVPGTELTRVLAGASRIPGHRRIVLGPFGQDEVTELVRRETGQTPTPGVIRGIRARTAGNPFFVRELSLLLTADGGALTEEAAVRPGVPSTVRDVVRDRMAGLDDNAQQLLQIAALVGREIDVGLLARVADLDVQTSLGRLEPMDALGLLGAVPDNPFSMRFTHDLVRESIAETTPLRQVPGLHLRVADGLEGTDPGGDLVAESLAHHLWAAGPLADAARTATALVRAGRRAMTKSAFEAAERQLRGAVQVARDAGLAELELSALSQLVLVLGMQAGYVGSPLDVLERAVQLARSLGREREAMSLLFTRFTGYSEGVQIEQGGRLAHRLRELGKASTDPVAQVYGWLAWGMHQWEIGNIGEAFRYLSLSTEAMADDRVAGADLPLLRDLKLLSAGMLGLMTTLHGDVAAARRLFDAMEADAGDDRYAITFWASFAVIAAAVVGDPHWALRTAERSIAVDPELSFVFLGTYPLLARWWGRAMIGRDPHAAVELDRLISTSLLDPPRSSFTTWYGALAELWLALERPEVAADALDRADQAMDTYGERHSEGMILLLRALLLRARGEPADVVRAAGERARALSTERGAHLFARRAERLLADLTE